MGHAPTIADLQKQNEEFSKYIESATANLKKRAEPEEEDFNTTVESFYKENNWDQQPLGGGSYMNYTQAAEFSLTAIDDTLDKIAKAVFAGGEPPGGTVMEDAKTVAKVATELADFQVLALYAARAFISNMLGVFDKSASTEYHSIVQSKSLAPGLMLHIWNFGDAFHRKDFFDNNFIIENAINFKLIYSFGQAEMEQDVEYMETHSADIEKVEQTIAKLQEDIDEMLLDPDKYSMDDIENFQKRIDFGKKSLESYRAEVDKCVKKYEGKS
jgi:hypothetical protein